jgi:hypothetical protein
MLDEFGYIKVGDLFSEEALDSDFVGSVEDGGCRTAGAESVLGELQAGVAGVIRRFEVE